MLMTVYFDNAATTRVRDEAAGAVLRVMQEDYGNPSSTHTLGRNAKKTLESARKSVAAALGANADEVHFTSGGTEANNLALFGFAEGNSRAGRHIITSAIEHDSVLNPITALEKRGWEVTYLQPDDAGRIAAQEFAAALRDDTALVSIMLVNNETGAINPVASFAQEIRRRGTKTALHCDCVQAFCKIPFSAKSLGADMITVSAHKIHGPKGSGALYVKKGIKLPPLILGGGQEREKRAGTEALPAIAGFGEAARLGFSEREASYNAAQCLRDYITGRLTLELPQAAIISGDGSPFVLSLSLPGYKSEVIMNFLEAEGIYVSKSAACKKGARSRVLEAMRLKSAVIDGAVRVSFSGTNTREEAEYFVDKFKAAAARLLRPL